jgi:hypothetical protein
MKSFSSIVVFSYNRLANLKLLINSLLENYESRFSKIYIFQDNFKNKNEEHSIKEIKNYINNIKGFKKKIICFRKKNYGLSKNITTGITRVFLKEKKAIFLEDDLVVSKYFLSFMNKCLEYYQDKKKIWSISAWNYNLRINDKYDAIITQHPSAWGWATWSDRWIYYKKNPEQIINSWSDKDIKSFNLDNSYDFFSQIERNYKKALDSWAIFWNATVFTNNGFSICPKKSLVLNLGFNKNATNTKIANKLHSTNLDNCTKNFVLPKIIKENKVFRKKLKKFLLSKSNYNFSIINFIISKLNKVFRIFDKFQKVRL